MSIDYSIDRVQQRVFTVAKGIITYSEVAAHLEKERNDNCLYLAEFIDATQATAAMSAEDVRQVIQRLRDLVHHTALGPTAVIVANDVSCGMMRMLEMLAEDICDIRPFRDRDKGKEWITSVTIPRPP